MLTLPIFLMIATYLFCVLNINRIDYLFILFVWCHQVAQRQIVNNIFYFPPQNKVRKNN